MNKIEKLIEKEDNKAIKLVLSNYVYVTSAIIAVFVFVCCSFITKTQPYGDGFPLSGNGFTQVYATYLSYLHNMKDGFGEGFINYNSGLASDNYSMIASILIYPWMFLIYKLVPMSMNIEFFSFMYSLRFVLVGPAFIYYLTHRSSGVRMDKKNPLLIFVSLTYSLSSYVISFYIYSGFGYSLAIPIIILGLEQLIYNKKPALYVITLFMYMVYDAYYAFIFCVFIVLYALTIKFDSIKEMFLAGFRVLCMSLVSAGMAAFTLVPYFLRTRNSPYSTEDSVVPSLFKFFGNTLYPLADYNAGRAALWTTPVEYRTSIYAGILVLLTLPLYFLSKNICKSEKIRKLCFLLLVYLAFDNQLLNYALHGMHYQWQSPNRFACFFVFVIVVMFYEVVMNFESFSRIHILCSFGFIGIILSASYAIAGLSSDYSGNIKNYIFSFVLIAMYTLIAILYCCKVIKNSQLMKKICLILLAIELCISGVIGLKKTMGYSDSERSLKYANAVEALTQVMPDMKDAFIITERPGDYTNENMSMMTGTCSASYYMNSSYKQQFDLYYRWGLLFSKNIVYYSTGSPLADMMLHVKYHITDSEDVLKSSPYEPVARVDNMILHENKFYLPLGIMLDNTEELRDWDEKAESYQNYESAIDRDNAFANALGINNIYDKLTVSSDLSDMTDDGNYFQIEKNVDGEGGDLYTFYLNSRTVGDVYIPINQALEYVGTAVEGQSDTLYFYSPRTIKVEREENFDIALLNSDNFEKLYSVLSNCTMYDQNYNSNSILGKIKTSKDGILYLSTPNIPGYKAYVNGEQVEIIDFMDGMGIRLDAGEYDIKLEFVPQGFKTGVIITIVALILFIVVVLVYYKGCIGKFIHKEYVATGMDES